MTINDIKCPACSKKSVIYINGFNDSQLFVLFGCEYCDWNYVCGAQGIKPNWLPECLRHDESGLIIDVRHQIQDFLNEKSKVE